MKQYSKWKDSEVKKLFAFIEQGKKRNENLSSMFKLYAKVTNRKPNSVRNYYYNELCELEQNEKRRNELKIDIKNHQKVMQKEFSLDETKNLVIEILKLTSKGYSVRKACQTLSGGDVTQMIRLQNKFRSVVLKDKELYESCLNKLQLGKDVKKQKLKNNIIQFENPKTTLTDSDINSLFLGLVRLVQKQTEEKTRKECNILNQNANQSLRKMLVKIYEKEKEIQKLRQQFKASTQQNQKLNDELMHLRSQNLSISQNKKLKEFAQSITIQKLPTAPVIKPR